MSACQNYLEPDIAQTPTESIIYTIDWPTRGLPAGAVISGQSFSPAGPTDYTISDTHITDSGQEVTFQLTGGIPGTTYGITNTITLSDGESMQATLLYQCVAQNVRRRVTWI